MGNPLDKYMRQHGHAPRFSRPDHFPDTHLTVEYHRGYVRLYHPRQGEFYITRNTWLHLLRASIPMLRHQDRQFSVLRATARYLRQERRHEEALRREKRARRPGKYRGLRRT